MRNTRFAIFAALFALATCAFHAQKPWVGLDLRTLSLVAALVVLLRPSSVALFLVFIVLQTAAVYRAMPWVNTNRTLHFLVGITVLASVPALALRKHPHGLQGRDLLAAVEPALRLELLIVYLFSFWHKLNTDFIDASTSCAVALYRAFVQNLSYLPLPTSQAAAPAVIFGTLVIEGALPLLLIIRRTRATAVVVAAMFHFTLGIAWFYSFSATMVALLFLFSPTDLDKRTAQWWRVHGAGWIVWYGRLLIGTVLLMVLAGVALPALREYLPAKLTETAQFWAAIRGRVFLNIWFQYAIAKENWQKTSN